MEGTIVRAPSNTFCFIQDDAARDRDIFAHIRDFVNPEISFQDIPGTRVSFNVIETPRGREAREVKILDSDAGREHGRIDRLISDSNFGFIEPDQWNGDFIFFHFSEVIGGWIPESGLRVTYTPGIDVRCNKTRALAVRQESHE